MKEVIICERCGTENPTSSLECHNCGEEFVNARTTKVPDEEERAIEHDFEPETIAEGRCVECGARNPMVTGTCLFCGGNLQEIFTEEQKPQAAKVDCISEKSKTECGSNVEPMPAAEEKVISKKLVDIREKKSVFELSEGFHVIGRKHEWQEHLASHDGVSGEHLHIHVAGDKVIMSVIETTNGTYYKRASERSMRELVPGETVILQPGDMIGLGRDDYNDPDFVIVNFEEC